MYTILSYSGGFSGLYNQFGTYQKWCRTTSARAQFYEKTLRISFLIRIIQGQTGTVNWKRQRSRRVNGLLCALLMQLKASPILSISLTKISYTAWLLVPRFRPILKQMFFRQKLSVMLIRWNSTKAFKMVMQIVSSTQ